MISSNAGRKLHDVLQQFDYFVVNHQPTRVTAETSILTDLVITSNPRDTKCTKTLELGISDHKLVYASISVKVKRPLPKIVRARTYKNLIRIISTKIFRMLPGQSVRYLMILMITTGHGPTYSMKFVIYTRHKFVTQ